MAKLLLLAALCFAAYAPSLAIPLLEDDYPNLVLASQVDPLRDPTFRLRSTGFWLNRPLLHFAGIEAWPYRLCSLFLHIVCTWLLFHLTGSLPAAAFFAIHEGHQEAVMWFSAVNELLQFVFGLAALLAWKQRSLWSIPALALALLSKESALVILPLLILVRRPGLREIAPHCMLAAAAIFSVWQSQQLSFRFHDGSFSLSAPFLVTLAHSTFRLLWIWGLLALPFVAWKDLRLPLLWILLSFLPYSFLTYSTALPSRQTYLASAGLAMIVGLALDNLERKLPRRLSLALAGVILIHNCGILWVKKRRQFEERAQPTEALLRRARDSRDVLVVRCFPQPRIVAEDALRLGAPDALSRLRWEQDENCKP
jgi:hypothetical protein